MRTQRLLLALIVVATLGALGGSIYAWPRGSRSTPPATVTVIIDHWGGTTPTTTPPADGPPAAFLRSAEGRDVRGGTGSYCWAGRCLDVLLPVSNAEPFFLVTEQGYSFRFDGEQPSKVFESWNHVQTPSGTSFANGRTWNIGYTSGGLAKPDGTGLYLVLVEAAWPEGRDASYGFYVQVP